MMTLIQRLGFIAFLIEIKHFYLKFAGNKSIVAAVIKQ